MFFRDLNVGEVLGWDIADMAEFVTIHAFVRAPFDTYVHDQTRFWNASGLSVKLAGAGVEIQLELLRALLLGGIAFETPSAARPGAASAENHVFPLFASQDMANAASYSLKIPLVSYFPGSVSELAPGSEVTMHGIVVGHVTDVRLVYDAAKDAVLAPVRFEVEPERVIGVGRRAFATPAEGVDQLVKQGLRATLQSASLITGQQVVALDFVPNAPPATVTRAGEDLYFLRRAVVDSPVLRRLRRSCLQGEHHSLRSNRQEFGWHLAGREQHHERPSAPASSDGPQRRDQER